MARSSSTNSPLDEIADELYSLAPEDFTAARNQHEKQARQKGDRDLAAAVRALAKPSVAAWLANQLVRYHLDAVEPLFDLGADMREATRKFAADELRAMTREQRELVAKLVNEARSVADEAGRTVSDNTARELEQTLHAALADENASAQLRAGRLSESLQSSGFGLADAAAWTPVPKPARAKPTKAAKPAAKTGNDLLDRAERGLADAEQSHSAASAARDEAQAAETEADEALQAAKRHVEELHRQLVEARAAVADADRARRDKAAAVRRADRAVSEADEQLAKAQTRRDQLSRRG